eukprot:6210909-Pleurochrysis_carterae.AAC.5
MASAKPRMSSSHSALKPRLSLRTEHDGCASQRSISGTPSRAPRKQPSRLSTATPCCPLASAASANARSPCAVSALPCKLRLLSAAPLIAAATQPPRLAPAWQYCIRSSCKRERWLRTRPKATVACGHSHRSSAHASSPSLSPLSSPSPSNAERMPLRL